MRTNKECYGTQKPATHTAIALVGLKDHEVGGTMEIGEGVSTAVIVEGRGYCQKCDSKWRARGKEIP